MEEEIASIIRDHGWFAANVSDHDPPFLYTIGLMQSWDQPELIVFGLDADNAHALFSGLIEDIRAGKSFAQAGVFAVTVDGKEHPVGFRSVHPTQHPLYLGFAMGYCRHTGRWGELQAVQAFWPDTNGKFPFEVGCDLDVYRLQPRLDLGLTPDEVRKFNRHLE